MLQTIFIDTKKIPIEAKLIKKNCDHALKTLISQQSVGIFNKEIFHAIISASLNNNKSKRLLYYYFETMMHEPEFVMCVNQINKDLTSPNEYIRGLALKLVSRFENYDHVNLKLVKENLVHKHYYVRMNAVKCLCDISIRFDLDEEDELINLAKTETNIKVKSIILSSLLKMNADITDIMFNHHNEDSEIEEILVEHANDIELLQRCSTANHDTIAFKAMYRLLKMHLPINMHKLYMIMANSVNCYFKLDMINMIENIRHDLFPFLNLLDPFNVQFSVKIIDRVIKIATPSEYIKISDKLFYLYKDMSSGDIRKHFQTVLLDKITEFTNAHGIFKSELIDESLNNLGYTNDGTVDNRCSLSPEIQYSSLKFLNVLEKNKFAMNHTIAQSLIKILDSIQYGKIFRFALDTIYHNINKEMFLQLIDKFENNIECRNGDIFYLSSKSEIYLGGYICFFIVKSYKKLEFNVEDVQARTAALCLKFIQYGKENQLIDHSTQSTIYLYLRYLISTNKIPEYTKSIYEQKVINCNLFDPLRIPFFDQPSSLKKFDWAETDKTKMQVIQLSGIGDPLYIECNLIYTRYECILDMLIINQTEFYLPEFIIEFTYSPHLQLNESLQNTTIQPMSAITRKIVFNVLESANSFITAACIFRFLKDGDYSHTPYIQHLNEIQLDIREFLMGESLYNLNFNFQSEWRKLEWENIYSVNANINNMNEILEILIKSVNGHICNKEDAYNFCVCNFICYTIQKTPVLINICLSGNKTIETRVRSRNEMVVSNISQLLSKTIKSYLKI